MEGIFIILGFKTFSPAGFVVMGLILLAFVVYEAFFSTKAQIKRSIRSIHPSSIANVKNGDIVKVTGKIVFAGRTLVAPLSGRKCAFYEVVVTEQKGKQTISVINEKKRGDVVLYDGTGYVVVRDHKTQSLVVPDVLMHSGTFNSANPVMKEFLNKYGELSKGIMGFNRSLTYKEGALENNEKCVVTGKAEWVSKSRLNIDIPDERILVISSAPNVECYISDDPELVNGN